jgi:hypothetical protein
MFRLLSYKHGTVSTNTRFLWSAGPIHTDIQTAYIVRVSSVTDTITTAVAVTAAPLLFLLSIHLLTSYFRFQLTSGREGKGVVSPRNFGLSFTFGFK